jgi:hypothetical protein
VRSGAPGVRRAERVGLRPEVGQHDIPRCGVLVGHGPRRRRWQPVCENTAELRPPFDAVRASIQQRLLDPVEHLGGAVLGQLHLDLRPPGEAGRGGKGLAGDPVIGNRGERMAVAVDQHPLPAGGVELDHRDQRRPAVCGAGHCQQRGGWGTEFFRRQSNLVAGVRAGR